MAENDWVEVKDTDDWEEVDEAPKPSVAEMMVENAGLAAKKSVGTTALAGAGGAATYGIAKGIGKLRDPRIAYKGIEQQLQAMQPEVGLALGQTPLDNISQTLKDQATALKSKQEAVLQNIDTQTQLKTASLEDTKLKTQQTVNALKKNLDVFDETILNSTVDDLSTQIKTNYTEFFKGPSASYEKGLMSIENHFDELGKTIDSISFSADFLDEVANEALKSGIPDSELTVLKNVSNTIVPKFDQAGVLADDVPMTIKQAKGFVNSITQDKPNSRLASIARNKWGKFLEKNASGEISDEIKKLNSWYRRYKELQTSLLKISDSKTGEFNKAGLNRVLHKYVGDRRNDGIVDLLDYLAEGTEEVPAMKGVKGKTQNFYKMLKDKFKLEDKIAKTQEKQLELSRDVKKSKISTIRRKDVVQKNTMRKLRKLEGLTNKYNQLSAKLIAAGEKIPFRFKNMKDVFKGLRKVGYMAGGKLLSATPSVLSMVGLARLDPTDLLFKQQFGMGVGETLQEVFKPGSSKKVKRLKALQEKDDLTDEEFMELYRAGLAI